jgi:hypothetical protein
VVDIVSTGVALRRGRANALTLREMIREMKRGLAAMRAGGGDSRPEPAEQGRPDPPSAGVT